MSSISSAVTLLTGVLACRQNANGGPSEVNTYWKADTGFSDADTADMTAAFRWFADKTYKTLLERGKFVWNRP